MDLPVNIALRFWEHRAADLLIVYEKKGYIPKGWKFDWLREVDVSGKNIYGLCDYKNKKILLLKYYAINGSFLETEFLIRHELAHAVVGPGEGHGKKWKDACKVVGTLSEEFVCQPKGVRQNGHLL